MKKQFKIFSGLMIASALVCTGIGFSAKNGLPNLQAEFNTNLTDSSCILEWNASNKPTKDSDNIFKSRSKTVQLVYGSNVDVSDKNDHVSLKDNNAGTSYIKTSGLKFDGNLNLGGEVNGLRGLNITFDDSIANLQIDAWNSDSEDGLMITRVAKQSGDINFAFTDEEKSNAAKHNKVLLTPNQFKISRIEKSVKNTNALSIKNLKVYCSAVSLKSEVSTQNELENALANSNIKVIKFAKSISINKEIPIGKQGLYPIFTINRDMVVDFNGFNINYDRTFNRNDATPAIFGINGQYDEVLKTNSIQTVIFTNTNSNESILDADIGDNTSYGINILSQETNVIFKGNIKFLGAMTAIQVQKGHAIIEDGYYDVIDACKGGFYGKVPLENYVVNCIDESFKNGTATFSIMGGKFCFDPSCKPETPQGSTYVASGYKAVKDPLDEEKRMYKIIPSYENGIDYKAYTEEDFQDMLNASYYGTLTLNSNIGIYPKNGISGNLTQHFIINRNININFNGYKIMWQKITKEYWDALHGIPMFFKIQGKDTVASFVDKTSRGGFDTSLDNAASYGTNILDGATLNINGGTYVGSVTAFQIQQGALNITDGAFLITEGLKGTKQPSGVPNEKYIVNCIDKYFNNGATISITGGTFDYDPSADPEGTGTTYLADNCFSVKNSDGTYTIYDTYVPMTAEEFQKQIDANYNGTYKLPYSIGIYPKNGISGHLTQHCVIEKNITIDFNGHKLMWQNITKEYWDALHGQPLFLTITNPEVGPDTVVNFKDSSGTNMGGLDTSLEGAGSYGVNIPDGATLNIEGGTYIGSATAIQVEKGNLNIADGIFKVANGIPASYAKYLINCIDKAFKDGTAKICVKGGTFDYDPSADPEGTGTTYLADGYKAIKDNNGRFTVVTNN